MNRTKSLEIRESHIIDGAISASVWLEGENIGSLLLNLTQWDQLRATYNVRVRNLGEQAIDVAEEASAPES